MSESSRVGDTKGGHKSIIVGVRINLNVANILFDYPLARGKGFLGIRQFPKQLFSGGFWSVWRWRGFAGLTHAVRLAALV
jgi:hypothetical protein